MKKSLNKYIILFTFTVVIFIIGYGVFQKQNVEKLIGTAIMNYDDIEHVEERVWKVLLDTYGPPLNFTNDSRLNEDLELGDLDKFELSLNLKDEFGIMITDVALDNIIIIGDLTTYFSCKIYNPGLSEQEILSLLSGDHQTAATPTPITHIDPIEENNDKYYYENIEERVWDVLLYSYWPSLKFTNETRLDEYLELEESDKTELSINLKDEFGIMITDVALEKIITIGDLTIYFSCIIYNPGLSEQDIFTLLSGGYQTAATPTPITHIDPIEENYDNIQYRLFAYNSKRHYEISSSDGEYYTSELQIFPFWYHPANTLSCNNKYPYDSHRYPDLYNVIGDVFGGYRNSFYTPVLDDDYTLGKVYSINFTPPVPTMDNDEEASIYVNNINYIPVDFALTDECLIGEVILAKGIDEEGSKYYVLPCDGRVLEIVGYQALFRLLGNKYGGDGKKTFTLPDFNSSDVPIDGAKYYIRVNGRYPVDF